MPKLYSYSYTLAVLTRNGFYFVSQKCNHIKYRKDGNPDLTVIIPPERKEMPIVTFNSFVKQTGLPKSAFEE